MALTLQDVFNINWTAFVVNKQGPGYDKENGRCEYQAPNGNRCAIGVCLPEDVLSEVLGYQQEYRKLNDDLGSIGPGVKAIVSRVTSVANLFDVGANLLDRVQGIHDEGAGGNEDDFTVYMERSLRTFAQEHGLTIPSAA
jgi:hypothetical protein